MNIDERRARAERALQSASLLLDDKDYNGACSTAYYAMFYAARTALLHIDRAERAMGKTHSGMLAAFNEFVVRPGLVEVRHGKALSFEFARRLTADYEAGVMDAEAGGDGIANARAFVAAVEALVKDGDDAKDNTDVTPTG